MTNANSQLVGRRGELLAELFLQELSPIFVARSDEVGEVGIDFYVGFRNARGGMNLVVVEVKATERPVALRYPIARRTYDLLAKSNVPGLLLVVDVKGNRIFFSEMSDSDAVPGQQTVSVQVIEADARARADLRKRLSRIRPKDTLQTSSDPPR